MLEYGQAMIHITMQLTQFYIIQKFQKHRDILHHAVINLWLLICSNIQDPTLFTFKEFMFIFKDFMFIFKNFMFIFKNFMFIFKEFMFIFKDFFHSSISLFIFKDFFIQA